MTSFVKNMVIKIKNAKSAGMAKNGSGYVKVELSRVGTSQKPAFEILF